MIVLLRCTLIVLIFSPPKSDYQKGVRYVLCPYFNFCSQLWERSRRSMPTPCMPHYLVTHLATTMVCFRVPARPPNKQAAILVLGRGIRFPDLALLARHLIQPPRVRPRPRDCTPADSLRIEIGQSQRTSPARVSLSWPVDWHLETSSTPPATCIALHQFGSSEV